jgi:tetratricopeptide (TPR) repeat protein
MRLGEPADSLSHLMEALDIARQTRDFAHEAQWLASLGQALWTFDQPEDAQRVLTEGLAVARRIDDVDLQASMLALLGKIYAADGQAPKARETFHRALELNKRLGNVREQMALMTSLGNLAAGVKQYQQATNMYEGALKLASERNDLAAAARLHGRLGRVAQNQRDQASALNHYKRALHFAESTNQDRLVLQALLHLATAQHAVADSSAAATYRRAVTVAQQLGDGQREALVRLNLGILLDDSGHHEEALSHLYRASDLAADLGPSGVDLLNRIEDAIDEAGGSTTTIMTPNRHDDYDYGYDVARDNTGARDDQLYYETTLPPQ